MAISKLRSSKDYVRIWFLWQRQAVYSFLAIVIIIMFYAYSAKNVYQSNAEILVMPKTMEGEVITRGTEEQRVVPVTDNDIYTEIEIITSHSVLLNTLHSLESQKSNLKDPKKSITSIITDPIKNVVKFFLDLIKPESHKDSGLESEISDLKDSLVISPVLDSHIIEIALQGELAENTFIVLKSLLKNYFEHRSKVFSQEKGLNFFSDQSHDFREKLDKAEKKLKAFELTENIYDFAKQIGTDIELISKLTDQLKMLEITYAEGNARTTMLKADLTNDPEMVNLSEEMHKISAIQELEKGLVPVLIERSAISGRFSKTSRQYQNIDSQILMLREEIRYEVEKAINTDELELEGMCVRIECLKFKISELKSDVSNLNQQSIYYEEIKRKVDMYKNNLNIYENKTENARVFKRKSKSQLANVSVASDPACSRQPIAPKRFALFLISLGLGVLVAAFLPFVMESIDNKLKSADDVEVLVGLPVVCSFNEIS